MADLHGPISVGSTPLTEEEKEGLRLSWVATRRDLNEVEQANITRALLVLRRRKLRVAQVLDDAFVRHLHRLMFDQVWSWAGAYRHSDKNIGVPHWDVPVAVRHVMADAANWVGPNATTAMPEDEAAARIHYRLALVHPFLNGNGRHTRAYADLLLRALGRPPFSWGAANVCGAADDRTRYLEALRAADLADIGPLLAFVRT